MNLVSFILKDSYIDSYKDNVFWVAEKVLWSENVLDIHVDENTLVGIRSEYSDSRIVSIREYSNDSNCVKKRGQRIRILKNVLISSGSVMWIGEKIVVKKRTSDAIYDPNAWTTAAGRCDYTVFETGARETREEIQIIDAVTKRSLVPSVLPENGSETVETFESRIGIPEDYAAKIYTVNTILKGVTIETARLWALFDENGNSIETRIPIVCELDHQIHFYNREDPTHADAYDPRWLKDQPLVPSLRALINMRNET